MPTSDVSELDGDLLDKAVGLALGWTIDGDSFAGEYGGQPVRLRVGEFHPSVNWHQGGPIIENMHIFLMPLDERDFEHGIEIDTETGRYTSELPRRAWNASIYEADWFDPEDDGWSLDQEGQTALIAAMRAFVAWQIVKAKVDVQGVTVDLDKAQFRPGD